MLGRVSITLRRSVDFSGDPGSLGTSSNPRLRGERVHVARDSAHCADLVVERIVAAVSRLRGHPHPGRVVPELGNESMREVIHGNYRIVSRLRHDVVEIATVFHGARLFRLDS
jgi:plasmid stabilization system protein ParE